MGTGREFWGVRIGRSIFIEVWTRVYRFSRNGCFWSQSCYPLVSNLSMACGLVCLVAFQHSSDRPQP